MSIRKVLVYGDEILRNESKEVHKVSAKIQKLIKDLRDTMYADNGVGLAAPQIGENVRVFVIDCADPDAPPEFMVFVNPRIIAKSGAVNSYEGCLSFPDAYTNVRRYANVKVKALNEKGKPFVIEAEGGSLLARCLQHEIDHLDGKLFVDHARNRFEADQVLAEKGLPPIQSDKLLDEPELEDEIAKQPVSEEN